MATLEASPEEWETRDAYSRWIKLIGRADSQPFIDWLDPRIDTLGLRSLRCTAHGFGVQTGSIFDHPSVVKKILQRARSFGPEAYNDAQCDLATSLQRHGSWNTRAANQAHAQAVRIRSQDLVQTHRHDSELQQFYQKVAMVAGSESPALPMAD
jgi:hypothetical protein